MGSVTFNQAFTKENIELRSYVTDWEIEVPEPLVQDDPSSSWKRP